ncbi:MAG: aminotransferase class V-fold PLP-dependent enzyme [archaeon]
MQKDLVYFNNAATSFPKPKCVIDGVNKSLRTPYGEHGRSDASNQIDYPKLTRTLLFDFFGGETPENFQFTSNATESLNILIHGFIKKQNGKIHVITSELEHNSVLRPLYTLEKQHKITLGIIGFDKEGYVTLNSIKAAKQKDTKLAVLTHGSNVLGSVQDIERIGAYLSKENIFFIVDGAQTAGNVKINLSKIMLDAFVFTGHKSLLGYQGIGGFYIKDPNKVESCKQGGTGVFSEYKYQPDSMPLKFEAGTLNYPGIVSLYEGIRYLQKNRNGIQLTKKLTAHLIKGLKKIRSLKIYNNAPDLPIIAFNISGIGCDDVGYILAKHNIITRTGLHCAPLIHKKIDKGKGCVRVSLSSSNTPEECDQFIRITRKIVENIKST